MQAQVISNGSTVPAGTPEIASLVCRLIQEIFFPDGGVEDQCWWWGDRIEGKGRILVVTINKKSHLHLGFVFADQIIKTGLMQREVKLLPFDLPENEQSIVGWLSLAADTCDKMLGEYTIPVGSSALPVYKNTSRISLFCRQGRSRVRLPANCYFTWDLLTCIINPIQSGDPPGRIPDTANPAIRIEDCNYFFNLVHDGQFLGPMFF